MKQKLKKSFSLKKQINDESGAVAVLVALLLTVLLMFTALAVDFGLLYMQESKLQTACDAASLAAAKEYIPGNCTAEARAKSRAKEIMKANGFDITDADVIFNATEKTVQVKKKIDVKTTFASVMNINYMKAQKSAKAGIIAIPGAGGGEYAIFSGSTTTPLTVGGSLDCASDLSVHTNKNIVMESSASLTVGARDGVDGGKTTSLGNADTTGAEQFCINGANKDLKGVHGEEIILPEPVEMPDYEQAVMNRIPKSGVTTDVTVYDNLEAYYKIKKGEDYNSAITLQITENIKVKRLGASVSEESYTNNIWETRIESVSRFDGNIMIFNGSIEIVGDSACTKPQREIFKNIALGKGCSIYARKASVVLSGATNLNDSYIVAEGDIDVQHYNGISTVNATLNAVYSKAGDINFCAAPPYPGAPFEYNGLIYAPKGRIYLRNYSISVYGNIVADSISIETQGYNHGWYYHTGSLKVDNSRSADKFMPNTSSTPGGGSGDPNNNIIRLVE